MRISTIIFASTLLLGTSFSVLAAQPSTNSSVTRITAHQPNTDIKIQNAATEETVNINSADIESIAHILKGIGLKKAAAIVAFRDQNGPFKEIDDLAKVNGISKKLIERNRDRIIL